VRADLRGFAFGVSISLAVLAGFGAANLQRDEIGRYQVAAAQAGEGDLGGYILDTVTGEAWTNKTPQFFEAKDEVDR
jgi:hypothetical protein